MDLAWFHRHKTLLHIVDVMLHPIVVARNSWVRSSQREELFFLGGLLLSTGVHLLASLVVPSAPQPAQAGPAMHTEVINLEPPAPQPPEPQPPEPQPPISSERRADPKSEPLRAASKRPETATHDTPALAEPAPDVLTAEKQGNEALDFTHSIMTGSGALPTSGTANSRVGSIRGASRGNLSRSAEPAAQAASGIGDGSSRPASILGGASWNCPFPRAADHHGIDRAVVSLRVHVDAAGRASSVRVLSDPGHGFGGAAQACAARTHYRPALDRHGRTMASPLNVRVRFVR